MKLTFVKPLVWIKHDANTPSFDVYSSVQKGLSKQVIIRGYTSIYARKVGILFSIPPCSEGNIILFRRVNRFLV